MTQLLYRLDNRITDSYNEYIEGKDSCEIAYKFYIEDVESIYEKSPTTYDEVVGREVLPYFN